MNNFFLIFSVFAVPMRSLQFLRSFIKFSFLLNFCSLVVLSVAYNSLIEIKTRARIRGGIKALCELLKSASDEKVSCICLD